MFFVFLSIPDDKCVVNLTDILQYEYNILIFIIWIFFEGFRWIYEVRGLKKKSYIHPSCVLYMGTWYERRRDTNRLSIHYRIRSKSRISNWKGGANIQNIHTFFYFFLFITQFQMYIIRLIYVLCNDYNIIYIYSMKITF